MRNTTIGLSATVTVALLVFLMWALAPISPYSAVLVPIFLTVAAIALEFTWWSKTKTPTTTATIYQFPAPEQVRERKSG